MRVAMLQLNPVVGDFAGNVAKLAEAAREAARQGAEVAVAPELFLPGYPPLDLLNQRAFLDASEAALAQVAEAVPEALPVLVGTLAKHPGRGTAGGKELLNAVALLEAGRARIAGAKTLLPTYDVFDERRYFEPCADPAANVVTIAGRRIGVTVCEDIWNDRLYWGRPGRPHYAVDPVERVVAAGAEVIVNLSASPYSEGKGEERFAVLESTVRRHRRPLVYVNQSGAQTGVIFDGRSAALAPSGGDVRYWSEPVAFAEHVRVVDLGEPPRLRPTVRTPRIAEVADALTLGIRDYFAKLGFTGAVVGLSGGIDSALVCTLAVRALGAGNVVGLSMPSRYSSTHSREDALALGRNLGVPVHTVPIEPMFAAYRETLAPLLASSSEEPVTEQNLQARIRGAILMAYSNRHGHLVLSTGNKTECAVGFCTLYGDTCGGLAVIADLWKREVYAMARWLNEEAGRELIPSRTLTKPPSPELAPDQLDTDSLPPYDVLDPLMRALVEDELPAAGAAEQAGVPLETAERFQRMLRQSEYKRYQFPPTLRVSRRAWVGRRYPIVQRFGG